MECENEPIPYASIRIQDMPIGSGLPS